MLSSSNLAIITNQPTQSALNRINENWCEFMLGVDTSGLMIGPFNYNKIYYLITDFWYTLNAKIN